MEALRLPAAIAGLVDEHQSQRFEEAIVADAVWRQVHLPVEGARGGSDVRAFAGDERVGCHGGAELAVKAERELVGLIVVGEEAGDVEAVDLVCSRRTRRPSVRVERAVADEAEQPRAVVEQVAQRAGCFAAMRREEAGEPWLSR